MKDFKHIIHVENDIIPDYVERALLLKVKLDVVTADTFKFH